MRVERRKFERHCLKDSAFAVIKAESIQLIPIVDISLGGLGISVNGDLEKLYGSSSLEILVDDCSFYLDNLSYTSGRSFRNHHWNTSTSLPNQFSGLKFVDLMPSQRTQLRRFIRKYTYGGKMPRFVRKIYHFLHRIVRKNQLSGGCQSDWLHRSAL